MAATHPLVLVGSYATPAEPGIYAFSCDLSTGSLTPLGSLAGIPNPSFLCVHPSRRWLYAVGETSQADGAPGSVWALRLTPEPWAASIINQQPSGGDWPCHLQIDPSGRWLLVSNYGTGSLAVLPIEADGSLGPAADLIQHYGRSVHPDRQVGPHTHSATWSPDGRFVIVADLGLDQLLLYALDPATGRLQAHGRAHARPGAGPRHLACHPNGTHVYVSNELDNTVAVYSYSGASGTLQSLQIIATLPEGAPESAVADIHLDQAARRLYVSNRGHNSLAVFDVAEDGSLARVATPSCGGDWPRNFALAPGGQLVLVANQYSGALSVLPLSADAQAVGAPVAEAQVPGASFVQFVPEA